MVVVVILVVVVVMISICPLSVHVILVGLLEIQGRPVIGPIDPAAVGSQDKQKQQRRCLCGEKVRVARHSGTHSEIGTIYILPESQKPQANTTPFTRMIPLSPTMDLR
jgi:hypothetical protein